MYVQFIATFSYRGLVTGPWFEFGGKCPIECAKSGYVADIDFHCKVKIQYTVIKIVQMQFNMKIHVSVGEVLV